MSTSLRGYLRAAPRPSFSPRNTPTARRLPRCSHSEIPLELFKQSSAAVRGANIPCYCFTIEYPQDECSHARPPPILHDAPPHLYRASSIRWISPLGAPPRRRSRCIVTSGLMASVSASFRDLDLRETPVRPTERRHGELWCNGWNAHLCMTMHLSLFHTVTSPK